MRFGPLPARLVSTHLAPRVVTPAYDTLTAPARARILAAEPLSFLHAMRSPDEYEPGTGSEQVLEDARAGLRRLLGAGAFGPIDPEGLFVYRLTEPSGRCQTGVVGGMDLEDAAEGRILPHETTRADKEDQLVAYLEKVRVASSPVALTHRPRPSLTEVIHDVTHRPVTLRIVADDGVRQEVWAITDRGLRDAIVAEAAAIEVCYLIDGHHRIAAMERIRRADPTRRRFLAALFPSDQLRVVAFHRAIRNPNRPEDELVADLRRRPDTAELEAEQAPSAPGMVTILTRRHAFAVRLTPGPTPVDDLDVVKVQRQLLGPLFGITDERTDPRVGHLPGVDPVSEYRRRIEEGEFDAVLLLHPMSVETMMAAADAGAAMPPKSTWFAPKPRSGLFLADQ